MPAVLQRLMRHKSIETTLRYYVELDADSLADRLWAEYPTVDTHLGGSQRVARRPGDTLGDTLTLLGEEKGKGQGRSTNINACREKTCGFGPEGKRMASGHTGNVVPRKGLRVRIPCPPL